MAVDRSEDGSKVLVVGKRFAVSKEKQDAHETKEEQLESFSKLQGKMQKVDAVDKDRTCMNMLQTCGQRELQHAIFENNVLTYLPTYIHISYVHIGITVHTVHTYKHTLQHTLHASFQVLIA